MNILGISAFYHDSAACLLRRRGDRRGRSRGALHAQEVRRTTSRRRRSRYCLDKAASAPTSSTTSAFYDKPLLKFERLLETYLAFAPRGLRVVREGDAAVARQEALHLPREMRSSVSGRRQRQALRLRRASRVACGQRLLSVAFRRSGDPHARRRRRMGHRELRPRHGQPHLASRRRCAFRIRSGSCTRRSRTTAASRSTPASTS